MDTLKLNAQPTLGDDVPLDYIDSEMMRATQIDEERRERQFYNEAKYERCIAFLRGEAERGVISTDYRKTPVDSFETSHDQTIGIIREAIRRFREINAREEEEEEGAWATPPPIAESFGGG